MTQHSLEACYHIDSSEWRYTPFGEQRAFIQPQILSEVWFHTGTACNLRCFFCFEGAAPGNDRLQSPSLEDVKPFMEVAVSLGVTRFGFTGGEPFLAKDFINILSVALEHADCLVLTNATAPLHSNLATLATLRDKPHKLSFKVSLDAPDPILHDSNRGVGSFDLALKGMAALHHMGFAVTVARQKRDKDDNDHDMLKAYAAHFQRVGLPHDVPIISYSELFPPCAQPNVPILTTSCMEKYKTDTERANFMCNYSKMVVKKNGHMRVYACTLVDDDPDYDLGNSLAEAMRFRIMLRHHRCFTCFASGISCGGSA